MNRSEIVLIALLLLGTSTVSASIPLSIEIVESRKIWDQATHNAFTDLAYWRDSFYCVFREGRGHVSTDGKIRVIYSEDGKKWSSAALISLTGYDLRDPHLSVTPDGRLMLVGGAAAREKDNQSVPTGTFVSFSRAGADWSEPRLVTEAGQWLWRVTWHQGKAYGVAYGHKEKMPYPQLLVSDDGVNYRAHVREFFPRPGSGQDRQGWPTEVTLRFAADGTSYGLVRRDKWANEATSAVLGVSVPDYTQWQWYDLGDQFESFGGPNFIQIPSGHWIGAGRMHQGGAHTALTLLDVESHKMTTLLKLPSGGDTSYPGLVWHKGKLYVSYYSSHEDKTSIYFAGVSVIAKEEKVN